MGGVSVFAAAARLKNRIYSNILQCLTISYVCLRYGNQNYCFTENTLRKLPFSFPNQARIAHYWHLYLYRLLLPLMAVGNVAQALNADHRVELLDGALSAALFTLLWGATWLPGGKSLRWIDCGVSLILWVSLVNALLQTALFGSASSIGILSTFLYWAPLIAVYWGMVFHDRRRIGLAQVVLCYAALLLIDPSVVRVSGHSLFLHGMLQAVLQALLVIGLVAVFTVLHAQMVENETLFQRAEHRANHDELTGLFNRRTFSQNFPSIARRAVERDLDLSLMLIDIDHFKDVNDHNGHHIGDQVLTQVGALLQYGLRVDDLLYRWGGDEFAVIMRDTDLETGVKVAERVRLKVEKFQFGLDRPITISIGVAHHQVGESYHELFRRADQAMLSGKQGGHNQVETGTANQCETDVGVMAPARRAG